MAFSAASQIVTPKESIRHSIILHKILRIDACGVTNTMVELYFLFGEWASINYPGHLPEPVTIALILPVSGIFLH